MNQHRRSVVNALRADCKPEVGSALLSKSNGPMELAFLHRERWVPIHRSPVNDFNDPCSTTVNTVFSTPRLLLAIWQIRHWRQNPLKPSLQPLSRYISGAGYLGERWTILLYCDPLGGDLSYGWRVRWASIACRACLWLS